MKHVENKYSNSIQIHQMQYWIYIYIHIYIQERGFLQEKGFHRWPEIEIVEPIQTAPGNLNKHLIFLTHLDDLFSWLLEWEKTEFFFFFYGVWMCMVSPNASPSLTGVNIHLLNTDHDYHQGPPSTSVYSIFMVNNTHCLQKTTPIVFIFGGHGVISKLATRCKIM